MLRLWIGWFHEKIMPEMLFKLNEKCSADRATTSDDCPVIDNIKTSANPDSVHILHDIFQSSNSFENQLSF